MGANFNTFEHMLYFPSYPRSSQPYRDEIRTLGGVLSAASAAPSQILRHHGRIGPKSLQLFGIAPANLALRWPRTFLSLRDLRPSADRRRASRAALCRDR